MAKKVRTPPPPEASPSTSEARDAPGCRRFDAAAVALRRDRCRRGRPDRCDRPRGDRRRRQRRQQFGLSDGRRALQPPAGHSQDEGPVAARIPSPGRPAPGARPDDPLARGRRHALPLPPGHLRGREEGHGSCADRDQCRRAVPDGAAHARHPGRDPRRVSRSKTTTSRWGSSSPSGVSSSTAAASGRTATGSSGTSTGSCRPAIPSATRCSRTTRSPSSSASRPRRSRRATSSSPGE
jgi:hypothetical protein